MINVPNILTIFRILLVPVFVNFILDDRLSAALVVFMIAGVTDALDGFIARAFSQRTELGANLDPLADKILLVTAFVVLAFKGLIPVWLCSLVILRDMIIFAVVLYLRKVGRTVKIEPSFVGKLTTFFQIVTIVYALFVAGQPDAVFLFVTFTTAGLTIYTGYSYAQREFKAQEEIDKG